MFFLKYNPGLPGRDLVGVFRIRVKKYDAPPDRMSSTGAPVIGEAKDLNGFRQYLLESYSNF